jgi:hypothetical protein
MIAMRGDLYAPSPEQASPRPVSSAVDEAAEMPQAESNGFLQDP